MVSRGSFSLTYEGQSSSTGASCASLSKPTIVGKLTRFAAVLGVDRRRGLDGASSERTKLDVSVMRLFLVCYCREV